MSSYLAVNIFQSLEILGVNFLGIHPSAEQRLSALREHARRWCETEETYINLTSLSRPLDSIFTEIVKRIATPDWEEFLNRAAKEVVTELDHLLTECTGGMVPDYFTFRREAYQLFEKGYSHRLYERIAQVTAEYFRHSKEISEKGQDAATHDAWVSFQKFKLFVSAIGDMREPARTLFERALWQ